MHSTSILINELLLQAPSRISISFNDLSPDEEKSKLFDEAAVKEFFYTNSVVVIGVSTQPANMGKEIAQNLFEFGFTGVIHLVGRHGGVMFGRRIHTSLSEITDQVDLAIVLTPAKTLPDIMEECGQRGILRLIIESGGFGEFSDDGRDLGDQLKRIAGKYGIRFVGPNCIGLMNSSNGFVTPFARMKNVFRPGGVGIIAQSGGVALSFLNMFNGEQLGYSKFAAIGNKLNVDENDLLEYFIEDPSTSVICLYLESVTDGRRLTALAKKSSKPIVVFKANTSQLSNSVAQSHTDALANDDAVVEASFKQSGIMRFRDMQTYLDFVKVLQLPQMKGRNLAIASRSGGHAVIAADAAVAYGFNLQPFGEDFLAEIRKHLRADVIKLANPLDLGDLFDFDIYLKIIEHALQEPNIDGMLFLHTYFAEIEGESSRKLLKSAAEMCKKYSKPMVLCVSTEQSELSVLHKMFDFPIFMSPERAIASLDRSINYEFRRQFIAQDNQIVIPDPQPNYKLIAQFISDCRNEGRSPLLHEALGIISALGIKVPKFGFAKRAEDVPKTTSSIPEPYAIKIISNKISHKSDAGGVFLNVPAARTAQISSEIQARFNGPDEFNGILVQQMIAQSPGSFELIVGAKRDPHFGPVVMVGHGGIFVEVLGKTSLRMAPLSFAEIKQMIEELPGSEMLKGVRGGPAVNLEALCDAVNRVASFISRFPNVASVEINPLIASNQGVLAVDARIFLQDALFGL